MSIVSLSTEDKFRYRSIIFHGKNSMTDMNLMMVGNTPLSTPQAKVQKEEIAFTDGDLNLTDADGGRTYLQSRQISYSFVLMDDFNTDLMGNRPLRKNQSLELELAKIFKWLYEDKNDVDIWRHDMTGLVPPGSPDDEVIGNVKSTELYDYAYGMYKFIDVQLESVDTSKTMIGGMWLDQINLTFTFFPYLQSFSGERVELATFTDKAVVDRGIQAEMFILQLNSILSSKWFLNDVVEWHNDGRMIEANRWEYKIRIRYTGMFGFRIDQNPRWNGVDYPLTRVAGGRYLDNDTPGEAPAYHDFDPLGYEPAIGYSQPIYDSTTGRWIFTVTATFENNYTEENPPYINIEWGVIRQFDIPVQTGNCFIMDAYTGEAGHASLWLNGTQLTWDTSGKHSVKAFALPVQPVNTIHMVNNYYDGLYKLRYDTTTRRL